MKLKLRARRGLGWIGVMAAALLGAAVLNGCATRPPPPGTQFIIAAREVPDSAARWQRVEPVEAGVRILRNGQSIRVLPNMRLELGDEVHSGDAAVVLRWRGPPADGEVVLEPHTRVRIGSLEVLFGKVFANVRGFFRVGSESVVAAVEGTRFLVSVQPGRSTRIAVAEGAVRCTPRNATWPPVRLSAGEALNATPGARPTVGPADPRELARGASLLADVRDAPTDGYCCENGQLRSGMSNRCSGNFAASEAVARALCRPPPSPRPESAPGPAPAPVPALAPAPATPVRPAEAGAVRPPNAGVQQLLVRGWCCPGPGNAVTQGLRSACQGTFSASKQEAEAACAKQVIR